MTRRAVLLVGLWLAGCGGGQEADVGVAAELRVRSGTFVRGALPEANGGPSVEAAYLTQTQFPAGFQGKSFSGVLGASATAVSITLQGDLGYWIVAAGAPLPETPGLPSFEAPLSFGAGTPAGPHMLALAAVDASQRFGEPKQVPLTLSERALPDGPLVFSLFWDRPSDLDLHVVLPDGTEVFKDNVNSWQAQGTEDDPEAFLAGGQLDLDSNAQCRKDGRNNENISWSVEPPEGLYLVRVATFSLCDEPAARWTVEARYHGERVALASGVSLGSDTRGQSGVGAGVIAFELQVR